MSVTGTVISALDTHDNSFILQRVKSEGKQDLLKIYLKDLKNVNAVKVGEKVGFDVKIRSNSIYYDIVDNYLEGFNLEKANRQLNIDDAITTQEGTVYTINSEFSINPVNPARSSIKFILTYNDEEGTRHFIRITAYNSIAKSLKHIRQGQKISITGRLFFRELTHADKSYNTLDLIAHKYSIPID